MSQSTPPPSGPPTTTVVEDSPAAGRGRRGILIAVVTVLVVVVLGGAALAWSKLSGGGARPDEALPASTVGVVSIDLDPSASQKISALKTLRKFPGLRKQLKISSGDDLRRTLVEEIAKESDTCKGLDYDTDVKPWIGERAAFAGVELAGKAVPALVLQVSDQDRARTGIQRLSRCADDPSDFGLAFTGDYAVVSDSTTHARAIVSATEKSSLADDATYQKQTEAAGDAGIVGFYVAPGASDLILDQVKRTGVDLGDLDASSLKKFQGLAGTVRFADGGVELSLVAAGGPSGSGSSRGGAEAVELPKDTAAALAIGVPADYAKKLESSLAPLLQAAGGVDSLESQLGIRLPGDLQTLIGKGLSLSLGGDAPATLSGIQGPQDVPVGLAVTGDPDKIEDVIGRIEEHTGFSLDDYGITRRSSGGRLALGPDAGYLGALLKDGSLGDSDQFRAVVPEAAKSSAVLYVDFDSDWRTTLAREAGSDSQELLDNTEPLGAFGLSAYADDGTTHVVARLSTD